MNVTKICKLYIKAVTIMEDPQYTFKEKGFPIIKVYKNYFEIKAIYYWEYRQFNF